MSKGKRMKRKKFSVKNFILVLLQLFLFVIIIYSGVNIINWINDNKKSKTIIENVSKSITVDSNSKYTVNFSELKQMNPDTVAWIKVNGTNIDFPVIKSIDNDFYLTHSFDKSYSGAGWIFMDCNNKLDGSDKNIIIYGHNRRDSSMFGSLNNILSDDWLNNEDNFLINFITEFDNSVYRVFSVYEIENEDYYITTSFNTDSFKTFISTIKNRSCKDFGIDVNQNDQILTLSTCGNNNYYRVVLHAVKL